ncbi:MAG: nicotinate-nucleotide--dimethylbenzimidazole phosphoribosyltransferase [Lentisphaeraceae bacterium]|nr:nicotinate-nucleotide--dimethylbenzimidazole phosphoribosyltransferase [Lentisphaeraceae bacterium]
MTLLDKTIAEIPPTDQNWTTKAEDYLNSLAMPPGALGQIHDTAKKLVAIQKTLKPSLNNKVLVMSAADHGIAAAGVSKYPQITDAIVKTATHGGAAINTFCRQANCDLKILDVGVIGEISCPAEMPLSTEFISQKIAAGTANILVGPAMTTEECHEAINTGIELAQKLAAGYDILGIGEMGIANTTSASVLLGAFCQLSAVEVTGPGTGVCGDALKTKTDIVATILQRNKNLSSFEILQNFGGFEIAAMTGLILGMSSSGKAVVLDGFISGAAALAAARLAPQCVDYLFAGHVSAEPAHHFILEELALTPLLHLDMRLGEGTGAAMAMNIIEASAEILNSMYTLDQALNIK